MSTIQIEGLPDKSKLDLPFDFPIMTSDETGLPTHGFKMVGNNSQVHHDAKVKWDLDLIQKNARRGRPIDAKQRTGAQEQLNVYDDFKRYIVDSCIVEIYGWTSGGQPLVPGKDVLDAVFEAVGSSWVDKAIVEISAERGFTTPSSGA
jgi:hypothetical protein